MAGGSPLGALSMNLKKYSGDSFDIVKRFLLSVLKPLGEWQVHPMFTREDTSHEEFRENARRYELFLGVPLVSTEFMRSSDRDRFVESCQAAPNLLLDPDTGIGAHAARLSASHLSPDEVEAIVSVRSGRMTVVYDQSFARGRKVDEQVREKLSEFKSRGIKGFAYRSHAHFVFLSSDVSVLTRARDLLIDTQMPESRFTPLA